MSGSSDWQDDKTRPGFAVPELPAHQVLGPAVPTHPQTEPPKAPAPAAVSLAPASRTPAEPAASLPIEVEVVHQRNVAPDTLQDWTSYQIWTRHRMYALDASLRCVEVFDRDTNAVNAKHRLLGARLVGGQTNTPRGMELSYPFPRPGAEAVFEHMLGGKIHFSHSSTVERVVTRMRIVAIEHDTKVHDAWETLTANGRLPRTPR